MVTFRQKYGDQLLGIALLIGVFELLIPLVTSLFVDGGFNLFVFVGLDLMMRGTIMLMAWFIFMWYNWGRIAKMFGKRKF